MEERIFTLAEARNLIPRLRAILQEVSEQWRRATELNPEIQKVRDRIPLDAFSPHGVEYVETVSQLMFLLNQIKEMGVVVKDVSKGLCDFPYMRQGRVVYLCWHLEEDSIGYWHDIESGFASREPLDESDI
jgi:hypothetical protein